MNCAEERWWSLRWHFRIFQLNTVLIFSGLQSQDEVTSMFHYITRRNIPPIFLRIGSDSLGLTDFSYPTRHRREMCIWCLILGESKNSVQLSLRWNAATSPGAITSPHAINSSRVLPCWAVFSGVDTVAVCADDTMTVRGSLDPAVPSDLVWSPAPQLSTVLESPQWKLLCVKKHTQLTSDFSPIHIVCRSKETLLSMFAFPWGHLFLFFPGQGKTQIHTPVHGCCHARRCPSPFGTILG